MAEDWYSLVRPVIWALLRCQDIRLEPISYWFRDESRIRHSLCVECIKEYLIIDLIIQNCFCTGYLTQGFKFQRFKSYMNIFKWCLNFHVVNNRWRSEVPNQSQSDCSLSFFLFPFRFDAPFNHNYISNQPSLLSIIKSVTISIAH